ncbi:MAG: septum site-determining protein MinC [Cyanobacteria bacterium J06642_11]
MANGSDDNLTSSTPQGHDLQSIQNDEGLASLKPDNVDGQSPMPSEERAALSARLKRSKNVELYVFDADAEEGDSSVPLVDVSTLDVEGTVPNSVPRQQITLKSEQGRLLLLLPPSKTGSFTPSEWDDLCQQLTLRLSSDSRFLQSNIAVHLIARDHLLDGRQLQELDQLLQASQLRMKRVYTQRRQTAVAAVTAGFSVEQQTNLDNLDGQSQGKALDAPLYVQTTVRSGTELRHQGSIVVLGDVNPGGSLIATGDIFVWGRLRGVVHAGAEGNAACRIMALQMQPTQLRIADNVARAPEKPPASYQPEVAYISRGSIRIAIASEFAQIHLNTP